MLTHRYFYCKVAVIILIKIWLSGLVSLHTAGSMGTISPSPPSFFVLLCRTCVIAESFSVTVYRMEQSFTLPSVRILLLQQGGKLVSRETCLLSSQGVSSCPPWPTSRQPPPLTAQNTNARSCHIDSDKLAFMCNTNIRIKTGFLRGATTMIPMQMEPHATTSLYCKEQGCMCDADRKRGSPWAGLPGTAWQAGALVNEVSVNGGWT